MGVSVVCEAVRPGGMGKRKGRDGFKGHPAPVL